MLDPRTDPVFKNKTKQGASLGGSVVKNPPASAGDASSTPIQGDPTCLGATKPVSHDY